MSACFGGAIIILAPVPQVPAGRAAAGIAAGWLRAAIAARTDHGRGDRRLLPAADPGRAGTRCGPGGRDHAPDDAPDDAPGDARDYA